MHQRDSYGEDVGGGMGRRWEIRGEMGCLRCKMVRKGERGEGEGEKGEKEKGRILGERGNG